MNYEEKLKCSKIYEIFTGVHTEPECWNEKAADHLAEMISKQRIVREVLFLPLNQLEVCQDGNGLSGIAMTS